MLKFYERNRNPKHHRTGDCTTRALAGALGVSWEEALTEQYHKAIAFKLDYTDKKVIDAVLAAHGFTKMKQPRKANGTKYTVAELDKLTTKAERDRGVYVRVANHDTVVIGDYIEDTWDCGCKTIGNYWIKS